MLYKNLEQQNNGSGLLLRVGAWYVLYNIAHVY